MITRRRPGRAADRQLAVAARMFAGGASLDQVAAALRVSEPRARVLAGQAARLGAAKAGAR